MKVCKCGSACVSVLMCVCVYVCTACVVYWVECEVVGAVCVVCKISYKMKCNHPKNHHPNHPQSPVQ